MDELWLIHMQNRFTETGSDTAASTTAHGADAPTCGGALPDQRCTETMKQINSDSRFPLEGTRGT